MSMAGTYSESLKACPIWTLLEPALTASGIRLKGCEAPDYYDFTFRLASGSQIYIQLLTPSSLEAPNKQKTIARLQHFAASSAPAPSRKAVVFLLSETPFVAASGKYALDGLLSLQVIITESLPEPIPIVPISDASCFLGSIQDYLSSLADLPLPKLILTDTVSLLLYTRTSISSHSLSEHNMNVLSDLFPSLRALSQAIRTHEGQAVVKEYLGDEVALDVVGFWDGDRTYD